MDNNVLKNPHKEFSIITRFAGKKVQLGNLIESAKTMRCGNRNLPVLSATKSAGIVLQSERFKKRVASTNQSNYLVVKRGQLITTIHLDQGVLGILDAVEEGVVSPAYRIWVINEERVRPAYLELALKSPTSLIYFKSHGLSTVAGRCNVPDKSFLQLELLLPPLANQDKIVEIFERIASERHDAEEVLNKCDALVKSRFVEMFGDPVSNTRNWQTRNLKLLGELKNGVNFKSVDDGCEIKCLGVGDFKDRYSIDDMALINSVSLNEEPNDNQILKDGDVVFVRSNGNKELVGRCLTVFPGSEKLTFSGFCIRFRIESDDIGLDYFLNCMKSDSMRKAMTGRGANIQNLSQAILSKLAIPIPPLALQQEFADFVSQVDKLRFGAC